MKSTFEWTAKAERQSRDGDYIKTMFACFVDFLCTKIVLGNIHANLGQLCQTV